jgi:hypothetical protein
MPREEEEEEQDGGEEEDDDKSLLLCCMAEANVALLCPEKGEVGARTWVDSASIPRLDSGRFLTSSSSSS